MGDRVAQAGSLKAFLDFQIHKVEPTKSNFYEKDVLLLSEHLMSWVGQWVDLDLFTTQFSDKVLLDTWKLIECKQINFEKDLVDFCKCI